MANIRKDTVQLEVLINGDSAGKKIKELRNQARDLKIAIDNLIPGTEDYIKASNKLKDVNSRLAEHTTAIKGVAKSQTGLVDLMKKGAAAAVGFFAVDRIISWGVQFTKWIVKSTSALEAMEAKTAIVFGESISIVEDFARANARSLGVTETKYKSLAAAIGDILIPMGFQREQAAVMASELTNLSGALSEWSNGTRSAEEINKILTKALTGERESLKELGIVITEAEIQAQLLARGQNTLTGSLLQQAKAVINLDLIMAKSQDAQTRFRINQEGTNRSMTRLNSVMEQAKEGLQRNFLPIIQRLSNAWANAVAPIQRNSEAIRDQLIQFRLYIKTLQSGELTVSQQEILLKKVNAQYKLQGDDLLSVTSKTEDYARVLKKVTDEFTRQIKVESAKELFLDARNKIVKAEVDHAVAVRKRIEAEQILNQVLAGRAGLEEQGGFEGINKKIASTNFAESNEEVVRLLKDIDAANRNFELTQKAALALGINVEELLSLLNGGATAPTTDPDPSKKSKEKQAFDRALADIERHRDARIDANEKVVQSDEQAALARQIIDLEATNEITKARIRIFSAASKEEERLTKAEIIKSRREIDDTVLKIQKLNNELSLDQSLALIEQEKQLRIQDLQDEFLSEVELARKTEIIVKESEFRIAQEKQRFISITDDAYLQSITDINARERELNRLRLEDSVADTIRTLELERDLTIIASHRLSNQLLLDEEDLQIERQQIVFNSNKKILEANLRLFDPDSPEAAAVRRQILEIDETLSTLTFKFKGTDTSDQSSDQEKITARNEELKNTALEVGRQIASGLVSITANRIEEELRQELNAIDLIEERKLAAAEGDAVLTKKIQAEARRDREKAEKDAARKRKNIARGEAVIQGALAVTEALPNPFAAIAAGVAAAIQLAIIESTTFRYGGYTGSGTYRDHTGKRVAGTVHEHEWVANEELVRDPKTAPIIQRLENYRVTKRGFADGGYTTVSTQPLTQPHYTQNSTASSDPQMLKIMQEIAMLIRQWPRELRANVSYTDIEDTKSNIDYIRNLATARRVGN